jgi:hypothetical protein
MNRRVFIITLIFILLTAFSASYVTFMVTGNEGTGISPDGSALLYVRRSRSACAALNVTYYPSVREHLDALRAAGGGWRELADAARGANDAKARAILAAGYRLRCGSAIGGPVKDIVDWGDRLGSFFSLLAVFFTAMTLLVSLLNFRFTRKAQRFANAMGLYRRFLELCVQYPRFAEPEPADEIHEQGNSEEFRQYQWFVGVLFRACEEVLEHGDDNRKWEKTVREQLGYHRIFIRDSSWLINEGLDLYSEHLQRLVREVRTRELAKTDSTGQTSSVVST